MAVNGRLESADEKTVSGELQKGRGFSNKTAGRHGVYGREDGLGRFRGGLGGSATRRLEGMAMTDTI